MTRLDSRAFLADFLDEAAELLDAVESRLLGLESAAAEERGSMLEAVLRDLHTLKGNAGMMGLSELQQEAHGLEDAVADLDPESAAIAPLMARVDRARELLAHAADPEADSNDVGALRDRLAGSVRVSFAALDGLVDRLMEVVIYRNRLADSIGRGLGAATTAETRHAWREVTRSETGLAQILERLRAEIMTLRMVPLTGVFRRLRRIVHDEAGARGKRVELRLRGGDTPVDKALLELASEVLGHLVRNAIVHGIEDPETRSSLGKPAAGALEIAADVRSDELVIRVKDDGAGIDLDALRERAASRGALPQGPHGVFDLVFLPGVSSHATADLGAGRGMGLAAVQEAVKRQGGHIEVTSERGRGTRFDLYLPLVVSITGALLVAADDEEYALPVASAVETLTLVPGERHEIHDAGVLRWRGRTIPLLDLGTHFGTREEPRRQGHVVVVEVGEKLRGLVVDDLLGLREIVVKSLDPEVVGQPRGILGSTVLGDGRAVLILDPSGLMEAPIGRERSA